MDKTEAKTKQSVIRLYQICDCFHLRLEAKDGSALEIGLISNFITKKELKEKILSKFVLEKKE